MISIYNRYVPRPDGSYQHSRVQDSAGPQDAPCPPRRTSAGTVSPLNLDLATFFRQVLPGGLDTGDLLIMLLLLLIAGDSAQERSHVLLTLALYLIL